MTESLKIGTLAPRSSPWGETFSTVEWAVPERSSGRLEIEFFYGGSHHPEGDGVAATATTLSRIYKPIIALQIPGLFSSWSKVEEARAALLPDLERGAKGAGFALLGWGDVGLVRVLARGEAIHTPRDLRGRRVRVNPADTITAALCGIVGATPVVAEGHEVLRALEDGAIDVVFAPVIAAEHMQWMRHLDHVTDVVVSAAIGGVALAQARAAALPAESLGLLRELLGAALAEVGPRVRAEDDASLRRIGERGRVVTPPRDALRKWQRVFQEVRRALSTSLPAEFIHQVERVSR